MQDRAFVNAVCARFPGAEVSQPFGPDQDCWKVGGKIFAIIGQMGDGVSVKTDHAETARLLIETGRAIRAPYLHAHPVRSGAARRAARADCHLLCADPGGPAQEGAGRAGVAQA